MSIYRPMHKWDLSPLDEAAHAACRHMHGAAMCRCGDRGERPCSSVESVVQHIAVLVRQADKQVALETRRARMASRKAAS